MERLEVRNVETDLIAGYLVREMGGVREGDTVRGEGWTVRLVPGESVRLGGIRVPVVFYEVEGEREADIAAYLRRKTMRGGG
jgi:hypothetical protein